MEKKPDTNGYLLSVPFKLSSTKGKIMVTENKLASQAKNTISIDYKGAQRKLWVTEMF